MLNHVNKRAHWGWSITLYNMHGRLHRMNPVKRSVVYLLIYSLSMMWFKWRESNVWTLPTSGMRQSPYEWFCNYFLFSDNFTRVYANQKWRNDLETNNIHSPGIVLVGMVHLIHVETFPFVSKGLTKLRCLGLIMGCLLLDRSNSIFRLSPPCLVGQCVMGTVI